MGVGTAFNAYTLLLFAGSITLDTQGRGLVVDGWLRLRGWARIGVLVSRLRGVIDQLIERRVENPFGFASIASTPSDGRVESGSGNAAAGGGQGDSSAEIIRLVTRLIELDGMDA